HDKLAVPPANSADPAAREWYRRPMRVTPSRYGLGMAHSRAVVVASLAAALLGRVASGWWLGGAAPASAPITVVHVVDCDALLAAFADGHAETVRVLGIDTPETVDPRKPVQCFGPEASAYAKAHLSGRAIRLEFDVEQRDIYGRLLAYVVVDGAR